MKHPLPVNLPTTHEYTEEDLKMFFESIHHQLLEGNSRIKMMEPVNRGNLESLLAENSPLIEDDWDQMIISNSRWWFSRWALGFLCSEKKWQRYRNVLS